MTEALPRSSCHVDFGWQTDGISLGRKGLGKSQKSFSKTLECSGAFKLVLSWDPKIISDAIIIN